MENNKDIKKYINQYIKKNSKLFIFSYLLYKE